MTSLTREEMVERTVFNPRELDGTAALVAAASTAMCKRKGEKDTEFVKRIVCAYFNAIPEAVRLRARILKESEE